MIPEYITERTKICRACSICDTEREMCNAKLYVNPDTNDVSTSPKPGFIKGCGCYLKYKIENINKHCPAGKW